QQGWQQLAEGMAKRKLQLGVFQGCEFAWARAQYPALKPLALAVNGYRYPVVYVLARAKNPARDFRGLAGQSLAISATGQDHLHKYLDRQTEILGKTPATFFSKIERPENAEDALDDVVDGMVQAAVTDRAALDAYKRRKPGRFRQLKEVARSESFPPPLVAYHDGALDAATLRRFRDGLLRASRTERGRTM